MTSYFCFRDSTGERRCTSLLLVVELQATAALVDGKRNVRSKIPFSH